MANVPYEIIAASKPFRFLVGPDKKEFFMHAKLVARMSKPLYALVNGEWKEAKESFTEWPEVDEGTFARFCEFAYTGDYTVPEPFKDALAELKNKNKIREDDNFDLWGGSFTNNGFGTHGGLSKKKKKSSSIFDQSVVRSGSSGDRDRMWEQFRQDVSDEPDHRAKESANTDPSLNYSEVLLAHARLYALADCYDVSALAELSVRKLHRTLKVFELHKGVRATDVAQLIDYAYKNTMNKGAGEDKLRGVLATYTACNIEEMWPNLYFQDVLESPEVSKAIIAQLLRRLN
ncbi:uncharacterized protein F4812DRAFT_419466 [Daldinia caldariorum]|uniref:uncharacterized protein n=1 Tax=Daldinia caldariorum TaxID=326644 RepID=UPI002008CDDE|nr:uncharacterized protein F4812DRAFT_419466 [Daldinia caldariorum]KAI1470920.1 hypothetical protein F4812DRAFT_419466 [Daldinia caldariorum]